MNGLDLKEMNLVDMLDVIHYFFESDISVTNAEQLEARDRARKMIYRDFYGYEYEYGVSNSYSESSLSNAVGAPLNLEDIEDEKPVVPFDPMKRPTKPFIPATQGNASSLQPFGTLLDGPLSH